MADVLGTLTTAFVGLAAVYVARQSAKSSQSQAETARQKLRLDLYERRYLLWENVRATSRRYRQRLYEIEAANGSYIVDDALDAEEAKLYDSASASRFLFEEPVFNQIEDIQDRLRSLQYAFEDLVSIKTDHTRSSDIGRARRMVGTAERDYTRSRTEFSRLVIPYLDFSTVSLRDKTEAEPVSTIQGFVRMARANWRALGDEERWRS